MKFIVIEREVGDVILVGDCVAKRIESRRGLEYV